MSQIIKPLWILRTVKLLNFAPVLTASRMLCNRVLYIDDVDVIDDFTSALVQNKSAKWDHSKLKNQNVKSFNLLPERTLDVDLQTMKVQELNELFRNVIEEDDKKSIIYLIVGCRKYNRCPDLGVVIQILEYFVRNSNIEIIEQVQNLVEAVDRTIYLANGKFNHYYAEALWLNGNVMKALPIFENVYRENIYLRRHIRIALKHLILDLTQRSEAVLANIVKLSEIMHNEFNDSYILVYVWQTCFLSEWFADQKLALELLEKNDGLCVAITNSIPFVVASSLNGHQIDVVYRLMEILLKYELKTQYTAVLVALFDYRYSQGDLRSCTEIIRWSLLNKIRFPSSIHQQFLSLLLKTGREPEVIEPTVPPNFSLKF